MLLSPVGGSAAVDVADSVGFGRISVSTFVEESYFDFGKQSVLISCIECKGRPSSGVILCNQGLDCDKLF